MMRNKHTPLTHNLAAALAPLAQAYAAAERRSTAARKGHATRRAKVAPTIAGTPAKERAAKARPTPVIPLAGPTRIAALPVSARRPRVIIDPASAPAADLVGGLRVAALEAAEARGKARGPARRKLERLLQRLPSGFDAGAIIDEAHSLASEHADAQRRARKLTAKTAAVKASAVKLRKEAEALVVAAEEATNRREAAKPGARKAERKAEREAHRSRARALLSAYFAARKHRAMVEGGLLPWEVTRFERPTMGQLALEAQSAPTLVGAVARLMLECRD